MTLSIMNIYSIFQLTLQISLKYGLYSYDVNLSPISGGSCVYFSKRKNKTNFYKKKINQKNIKLNNFFKWNNFSKDSLIPQKIYLNS